MLIKVYNLQKNKYNSTMTDLLVQEHVFDDERAFSVNEGIVGSMNYQLNSSAVQWFMGRS